MLAAGRGGHPRRPRSRGCPSSRCQCPGRGLAREPKVTGSGARCQRGPVGPPQPLPGCGSRWYLAVPGSAQSASVARRDHESAGSGPPPRRTPTQPPSRRPGPHLQRASSLRLMRQLECQRPGGGARSEVPPCQTRRSGCPGLSGSLRLQVRGLQFQSKLLPCSAPEVVYSRDLHLIRRRVVRRGRGR